MSMSVVIIKSQVVGQVFVPNGMFDNSNCIFIVAWYGLLIGSRSTPTLVIIAEGIHVLVADITASSNSRSTESLCILRKQNLF